jgi:hypothetical protein
MFVILKLQLLINVLESTNTREAVRHICRPLTWNLHHSFELSVDIFLCGIACNKSPKKLTQVQVHVINHFKDVIQPAFWTMIGDCNLPETSTEIYHLNGYWSTSEKILHIYIMLLLFHSQLQTKDSTTSIIKFSKYFYEQSASSSA